MALSRRKAFCSTDRRAQASERAAAGLQSRQLDKFTGKTLCARAVANRTDACFIRVIGSELVQKYVGEGARMVRELFEMARTKKACLIFFDEIDAVGGARFDDGMGGDNEVQRTMLELINQLDGFDPRGNIKVRLF